MRYVNVDGKDYNIDNCFWCPFLGYEKGKYQYCYYPDGPLHCNFVEIDMERNEIDFPSNCPLREFGH